MFTHCSFDATKPKLDSYRGKDCMERFCYDLKEHATNIINYKKREIITLTYKGNKFLKNKKFVIYAKKDLVLMIIKRCHKVWDHCHYTKKYRGAAHSICNLGYKTPK